jgi:chemotaxis family two-component system response regulator Rcp1
MQPVRILMVEDDAAQAELSVEMLRRFKLLNELDVVEDGAQALAFLRQEPPFAHAQRPDLILVDLNLPGMSGVHLVERLQSDPNCAGIPVVVLSGAEPRADDAAALQRLGKTWVTKPLGASEYFRIVRAAAGLSLAIVRTPPSAPNR